MILVTLLKMIKQLVQVLKIDWLSGIPVLIFIVTNIYFHDVSDQSMWVVWSGIEQRFLPSMKIKNVEV